MARIRTIKPDFFRHYELFKAERESGLPLRVAFAGLWTAADREGRFKWKPDELALDCLPHDGLNFADVLDALAVRGFIKRYEHEGKQYGFIPSWHSHQHVNQREAQSKLPDPHYYATSVEQSDREKHEESACAHMHACGEGEGKEGKGTEESRSTFDRPARVPSRFDEFWQAYPRRDGPNPRQPAEKKFNALVKSGIDPEMMIAEAKKLAAAEASRGNIGTRFIPQAITWLSQQRWADHTAIAFLAAEVGVTSEATLEKIVAFYARTGVWSRHAGPEPGMLGCRISAHTLAKFGLGVDGRKLQMALAEQ